MVGSCLPTGVFVVVCCGFYFQFQSAQSAKMRELERARDARRQEREAERRKREKKKADLEERIAR